MDGMQSSSLMGGIGGLLGGLFGNSGAPYDEAAKEYQKWANKAAGYQNPFYNAGVGAIPDFQNWLKGMQDPTKFINNITSQYQESPWAKLQQQQSIRSANNLGSASGLLGSTPLQMQAQQTAQGISSQDMNNWLQNVLGINSQYGAGQQSLLNMGANSANALTNLYGGLINPMGQAAYGREAGRQNDFWNLLGGGLQLGGMFFGL